MAIYWSPKSLPELRDFSPGARRAILDKAFRTWQLSAPAALAIVAFMLGGVTVGGMFAIAAREAFGDTAGIGVGIAAATVLCLFIWPLLLALMRQTIKNIVHNLDD
jgi:hypothetical protein